MKQLLLGDARLKVVDGMTDDPRNQNQSGVADKNAQSAHHVSPAVALEIGQQRTQALRQHADSVDEILTGKVQELLMWRQPPRLSREGASRAATE